MKNEILNIKDLQVWYKTYKGYAKVVNGVDFNVREGEKVWISWRGQAVVKLQ